MSIKSVLAVTVIIGASLTAATARAEGDAANGEKLFRQCKACHTVEAGKNRVGPSLFGVFGAKAGHVETFKYSDALKTSGYTWDDAHLDKWLTSPREMLPGTKMVFAGIEDAAQRADVIAYLKAQK